jgi:hypothetical protein
MNNRQFNQQRADHLRKHAFDLRAQPADSDEQRDYLDEYAHECEQEADEIDHYLSLESQDEERAGWL